MSLAIFDLPARSRPRVRTARSRVQGAGWLWRVAEALVLPVGLGILWQVSASAGWLPQQILPPPAMVAHTLADLWHTGELPGDLAISLWRVTLGFLIGSSLGLALGLGMGVSRTVDEMFGPLFRGVAQVPSMAWLPLLMLLLGVGETLKITAIAKAALIPTALAVQAGVRAIPAAHLELARALRLSRIATLRQVLLPAVAPSIFQGLRQGLSHAWLSLVAVELLASTAGLGYLMTWGRAIFQLDVVLAGILVVGVVGLLLDAVLATLQQRATRWSRR